MGEEPKILRYRDYLSKDTAMGISSSTIVIRKDVFDDVGGLRDSTPETFHCDDLDLLLRTGVSGPFVIVVRPTTVAYRMHESNNSHNVGAVVRGLAGLVRHEHRGEYPGGRARRLDRYARIGGAAYAWLVRIVVIGRMSLAIKLLKHAWPMIIVAGCQKGWRNLLHPARSESLPEGHP